MNNFRKSRFRGQFVSSVLLVVALLFMQSLTAAEDADTVVWRALLKQSRQLLSKGEFNQAADMAQQAIDFARQSFGETDPKLAVSLRSLAAVYSNQRRYVESVPLLKSALSIIELYYDNEHQVVAVYLSTLALNLSNLGQRKEAELLYERALAMREKLLGPEHLDLAYNLNALARFAVRAGDLNRAELLYRRALRIRQKNLLARNVVIAESWGFLAQLYKQQQRYADAVLALRQAVAIKRKKYGPGHKLVVGDEGALASLEKLAVNKGIDVGATTVISGVTPPPSIAVTGTTGKRGQRQPAVPRPAGKQNSQPAARAPAPANELEVLSGQARRLLANIQRAIGGSTFEAFIILVVVWIVISGMFRRIRHQVRSNAEPKARSKAEPEVEPEVDLRTGFKAEHIIDHKAVAKDRVKSRHTVIQDMNPRRRRSTWESS